MDEKRIDLSQKDEIGSRLARAQKVMRELKQGQFIGTDSIRFYKNDTGNAIDWSGQLPTSPQASYVGTKILKVIATAQKQNVLFADLISELRVNSNSNPRHTVIDMINEIYNNQDSFGIRHYSDPIPPDEANKCIWTAVIDATDSAGTTKPTNTCYAKFYIVANDDVDIEIVEVN